MCEKLSLYVINIINIYNIIQIITTIHVCLVSTLFSYILLVLMLQPADHTKKLTVNIIIPRRTNNYLILTGLPINYVK